MHERHIVSQMWCMAIQDFINAAPDGYDCQVVAAVTHDKSVALCDHFDYDSVVANNNPLGSKFNAGVQYALDNHDFDYLMLMGDDDIISPDAWPLIFEKIENKDKYFGFTNIYFYEPETAKVSRFDYADQRNYNKLIGCGRFFHRSALMSAGYQCPVKFKKPLVAGGFNYSTTYTYNISLHRAKYFEAMKLTQYVGEPRFELWDSTIDVGLDYSSEMRLINNGYFPEVIKIEKPLMVDVKTEHNIWSFRKFNIIGKYAEIEEVRSLISPRVHKYIQKNIVRENN